MDSIENFRRHGFFYIEDEAIGQKVAEVDSQGLSTKVASWDYFKSLVIGNEVSRSERQNYLSDQLT